MDTFILLGVVLMEALAAYPWLLWFGGLPFRPWTASPISFPAALGVILFAAAAARLASRSRLSLAWARVVALVSGILFMLLLVWGQLGAGSALFDEGWWDVAVRNMAGVVAGLVLGAYLLWRGFAAGSAQLALRHLHRRLVVGFGCLALLCVLELTTGASAGLPGAMIPYIFAFFAAGLLAAGLANYAGIEWPGGEKTKPSIRAIRNWLLVVAGAVGLLLLLGWLAAAALSFDFAGWLGAPLGAAGEWLLKGLVFVIAYPIGFLLAGLAWVVQLLRSWFGASPPPANYQPPDIAKWLEESRARSGEASTPVVFEALKWVLLALVIGAVIFLIARAIGRSVRALDNREFSETRESLWDWHDLRKSLDLSIRRPHARRRPEAGYGPPPWDEEREPPPDPRAVYARLLQESRRAGRARAASATPHEHSVFLADLAAGEKPALDEITSAYVACRYGGVNLSPEQLAELGRRWLGLREVMRSVNALPDTRKPPTGP